MIEIQETSTSIQIKSEKDAESYLKEFYFEQGYDVIKTSTISTINTLKLLTEHPKIFPHLKLIGEIFADGITGCPDLMIFNETQLIFVEVKLESGALHAIQMLWSKKYHNQVKIIVNIVKSVAIVNEIDKRYNNKLNSLREKKSVNDKIEAMVLIKQLSFAGFIITKNAQDKILKSELYNTYQKYCSDNKIYPIISKNRFGRLIGYLPGIFSKSKWDAIKSKAAGQNRCSNIWIGIKKIR